MNDLPYRVIWRHAVLGHRIGELLLEFSSQGVSSQPLFAAFDRINQLLSTEPETCGESRPDSERVMHVYPLTVTFEIHTDERIVFVTRAHYVRGHD